MLIGYARVSTDDQNLDLQIAALEAAGCQKIFDDKISGSRVERPGLDKMLEMLREGDTLVVWGAASSNWSIWSEVYTRRVSSLKASRMPSTLARHQGVSFSMSWPAFPRWNVSWRWNAPVLGWRRHASLGVKGDVNAR